MDDALKQLGYLRITTKNYIWGQNENRLVTDRKKKSCLALLNGAAPTFFYYSKTIL